MDDPESPDFPGWMRSRMAARRMSQRQPAQRAGVDHSTLSRLLRGTPPTLATATRIARALGTSADSAGTPGYLPLDGEDTNSTRRVEAALRSDVMLTEEQVRLLVAYYVRLRSVAGLRHAAITRAPAATVAPAAVGP